jgi:nicotinamide riboside kinase
VTCVKICLTGPESSGKSALAKTLSDHFGAALVEEQARQYLLNLGREHALTDLTEIAKLQHEAELKVKIDSKIIVSDTDLLTLKIWAEDKYDATVGFVEENLKEQLADLYLVCFPDLNWEHDELREDEHRRNAIYDKYIQLLDYLNANYKVVKGSGIPRKEMAIDKVNSFLNR